MNVPLSQTRMKELDEKGKKTLPSPHIRNQTPPGNISDVDFLGRML